MSTMWKDPVFESLDEISKFVLPYIISFQKELEDAFSQLNEIKGFDLVRLLKEYDRSIGKSSCMWFANDKIKHLTDTQSNLIVDSGWLKFTMPERIECNLVDEVILNDAVIKINLEISVDKKNILHFANDYRYRTVRQIGSAAAVQLEILGKAAVNKRLKLIGDIIGLKKENLKTNSTKGLIQKICILFSDFIESLDIRSDVIVSSAWNHLLFAVEGSENSIHWLKLLKARAQKEETMYSMEIA
jgi:hypothetical protein